MENRKYPPMHARTHTYKGLLGDHIFTLVVPKKKDYTLKNNSILQYLGHLM